VSLSTRSWAWWRGSGTRVLAKSGDDHVVEETASVCVVSFLQSDESVVTPGGTPRIAHNPGGCVVADCYYSVIQVGSAVGENATTLHLPLLSVDRNSHGSLDNAGLQCAISACYHLVASDVGEDRCHGRGFAGAILGSVRLVGFAADAVGLDVAVPVLHDAALAAVIHFVAVH